MSKRAISSEAAPRAVGAYSQAVRSGDWVFLSGQVPLDPESMRLVEGDISVQTRRVMDNLGAVLREAGLGFGDVLKATVYLADIQDFKAFNTVYGGYFEGHIPPARAAFQVAALPLGALIEIEMIARG